MEPTTTPVESNVCPFCAEALPEWPETHDHEDPLLHYDVKMWYTGRGFSLFAVDLDFWDQPVLAGEETFQKWREEMMEKSLG